MAQSKPMSSMKDLNTICPLCSQTFRSPKILRCLHTFCEECLHEYFLSLSRSKRTEGKINEYCCPTCKFKLKLTYDEDVEKLSGKLHRNVVMETLLTASNETEQKCNPCERSKETVLASIWCNVCVEAFCETCHAVHSKMKLTLSHEVIPIKDFRLPCKSVDLDVIIPDCHKHAGKELVVFCHDHKVLCCCSCPCIIDKRCKKMSSVNDMISDRESENSWKLMLDNIRSEAKTLKTEKETEKSEMKAVVEAVEKKATEFFEKIKCMSDSLFNTFVKQIHTARDEENTHYNIRIRLLEQFIKNTEHWISMASVVQEHGSSKQMLLLKETFKEQIKASLHELHKNCKTGVAWNCEFQPNETITKAVEKITDFGWLIKKEKLLFGQVERLMMSCEALDITIRPNCRFDDIKCEFVGSIHHEDSYFTCGTCINENTIVLGNSSAKNKLQLIDKKSGDNLSVVEFQGDCYRLCFVPDYKCIFISCYETEGELYRLSFSQDTFTDARKLKFTEDYVGAMIERNGTIYIIVDLAIKQFPVKQDPESLEPMSTCFAANTDCGRNGMVVFEDRLIFTTKSDEVKCNTFDGTDVFCFDEIETPWCLEVLPSGAALVVDRSGTGSLHVISEDGTQHKTLVETFKNITEPYDIWMDEDGWTFYIAGGEYIEVYRLL